MKEMKVNERDTMIIIMLTVIALILIFTTIKDLIIFDIIRQAQTAAQTYREAQKTELTSLNMQSPEENKVEEENTNE